MTTNGSSPNEILNEIDNSEILDMSEQGIIIAKSKSRDAMDPKDYRVEVGSTGLKVFGGYVNQEFLTELQGLRGYRIYDEMRKNDPVIGGLLFATEQAIRRVKWFCKANDTTDEQKKAAEFVEECRDDMSLSWNDFISEALTFLPFGFSLFEIVYKERNGRQLENPLKILTPTSGENPYTGTYSGNRQIAAADYKDQLKETPSSKYNDGKIGWRKFAYRPPDTLFKWEVDARGGIRGMWQQDIRRAVAPVFIPIEKSILFRTRRERNNPEGVSVLRTSYRPYFFKRELEKFEAIALERTGAGIPVIKLPMGYTKTDLDMAKRVVRRIRVDEQMGVTLPPNWELELLRPAGRAETQTYEEAIHRYSNHILMSLLLTFVALGTRNVGSLALVRAQQDFFRMALVGWVNNMAETISSYAVKPLFELNSHSFSDEVVANPPHMETTDIGEYDLDTISNFIMRLAQVGFLTPDDAAEDYARRIVGLPSLDESTDEKDQRMNTQAEDVIPGLTTPGTQKPMPMPKVRQGGKQSDSGGGGGGSDAAAAGAGTQRVINKPYGNQNAAPAVRKAVENDKRLRQYYRELILKGVSKTDEGDLTQIRGMIEEVVSELMDEKLSERTRLHDDGGED